MSKLLPILGFVLVTSLIIWFAVQLSQPATWSPEERQLLASLSLSSLQKLPADPSNHIADDLRAAKFGQQLFFDTRFSINGAVACATCHQPERRFADGLIRGVAIGQTDRNTPSVVGGAYSPWQYWDGRKDSQWSQALAPLEHPMEQGGNRLYYLRLVASFYKSTYEAIFGALPDLSDTNRFPLHAGPVDNADWRSNWLAMDTADQQTINRAFANLGKALAAYERRLLPGPSKFDDFVDSLGTKSVIFNAEEQAGLKLFIGKANCIQCHNGPLLTNHEFHNTGVETAPSELPDKGRIQGVRDVNLDEFNCRSTYADTAGHCAELQFARTGPELIGTMRTPSLRNLKNTEPYMHKGQLPTLIDVLRHYNEAPTAIIGHNEAKPLNLTLTELSQLEAFLHTLDAPIAAEDEWLTQPDLPQ